jgi:hypothetical protein
MRRLSEENWRRLAEVRQSLELLQARLIRRELEAQRTRWFW